MGRDQPRHLVLWPHARFNPRARVGRDTLDRYSGLKRRGFNPRARVGRDLACVYLGKTVSCFNPRARVGRDAPSILTGLSILMFQSTRPRGARPRMRVSR